MTWLIGTSGWSYDHWRGPFYPDDLRTKDWLPFYSQTFSTVEVNSTFYHMPRDRTMDAWRDGTPQNFVFALKMNRLITHQKKLRGVNVLLKRFLDTAQHLGDKLGVILHQLPPSMGKDIPVLSSFLKLLPKEMKHAVEFRDESWCDDETFDPLCSQGVAYCTISAPGFKTHFRATAPFAYVRMHGEGGWYASRYSNADLKKWASEIITLAKQVRGGYVYFNNDYKAYAVENALTLREFLSKGFSRAETRHPTPERPKGEGHRLA